MRRLSVVLLIALLCLMLVSCYGVGDTVGSEGPSDSPGAQPAPSPDAARKVPPHPLLRPALQ